MGGETYREMFLCGFLEVVLDFKKRLVYEPPIPSIIVPIFDGEDITSYPQTDCFLQRLRTDVMLEECDLMHLKQELWTLGQANERSVAGDVIAQERINLLKGGPDK